MSTTRKLLAQTKEIDPGTTKYIELNQDHSILIVNSDGAFTALYGKCSHYNLPLKDAALCEHRLRCPFHHACFDVRNGSQLEMPGLGGLQQFDLEVEEGDIYVELPEQWNVHPRPEAAENDGKETHLIVGGGVAAVNAIYGMRSAGCKAKVILITAEEELPYDRTALSKAYLQGGKPAEKLPLLPEDWYRSMKVDCWLNTLVRQIDAVNKKLHLEDGRELDFDGLLLATGASPRSLSLPGSELGNIFSVRQLEASKALREAAQPAKQAVVIGAGFIGLELAMSLGKLGCQVTVVAPEAVPFAKQWGERIGRYVQSLHEAAGVTFQLGQRVAGFGGESGKVANVKLENGVEITADIAVVGIGVVPNTDLITGVSRMEDGGLRANEYLEIAPDIYAAGDLVNYPDVQAGRVRIEHWKVAGQQGRIAGHNLASTTKEPVAYRALPFFWSNQQGKNFRYAGHAEQWDEIEYDGRPEDGAFIARYLKNGELMAVLGLGRDAELAAIAEQMNQKR
jgi:NADPH-dependent 2,4-dienoyl-CoA reductase/sulfur reductase-like enzyme/nitrite reductase/ring-hydroxylating ferredoxin subunit